MEHLPVLRAPRGDNSRNQSGKPPRAWPGLCNSVIHPAKRVESVKKNISSEYCQELIPASNTATVFLAVWGFEDLKKKEEKKAMSRNTTKIKNLTS